MAHENEARAQVLLQRAENIKKQAGELEVALPGQLYSPDDFRAYTVWWATEERYWKVYGQALAQIFGDIQNQDDFVIRAKIATRDLDELGARIRQFVGFVEREVCKVLDSLEKGQHYISLTPPNHPNLQKYTERYFELRQQLREMLPVAWRLISPAAHYYAALPEDMRAEAERFWGPICGHTDPLDFGPLWKRHFPTERMNTLDQRALSLGLGANRWPTLTPQGPDSTLSGATPTRRDSALGNQMASAEITSTASMQA